eukprot:1190615-Prorocentrum_minimum.AAC.3
MFCLPITPFNLDKYGVIGRQNSAYPTSAIPTQPLIETNFRKLRTKTSKENFKSDFQKLRKRLPKTSEATVFCVRALSPGSGVWFAYQRA